MSRDRSDQTSDPAIDEPAGDETVVAVPRPKKKPKFLPSDSGIKTAIYQADQHGERPATVPEGTDEIALEQPEVTETEVQTGMTLDPSQRARVLDVHDKAAKLLAELDLTANIKVGPSARIDAEANTDIAPLEEPTVDPTAATEPITDLEDDDLLEADDFIDDDDDDSLEEGETVVDPRARERLAYSTPLPAMPAHTPAPGAIPGARGVVAHTPMPGSIAQTPAPHHPVPADDDDEGLAVQTIETGWSPHPPPADNARLAPVAPRPMAPPPKRSVGSVLLAPFRAIASLFRAPQPQRPPSQQLPGIGESGNLQTYTQVNRMVQRRRQQPTSSPPPPDDDGDS